MYVKPSGHPVQWSEHCLYALHNWCTFAAITALAAVSVISQQSSFFCSLFISVGVTINFEHISTSGLKYNVISEFSPSVFLKEREHFGCVTSFSVTFNVGACAVNTWILFPVANLSPQMYSVTRLPTRRERFAYKPTLKDNFTKLSKKVEVKLHTFL